MVAVLEDLTIVQQVLITAAVVVGGAIVIRRLLHRLLRQTPPAHGSSLHNDASGQVLAQIDAHRGHSGEHSDEHWDGIRRLETGDTNPAF